MEQLPQLSIEPEYMEVANLYLQLQNKQLVAEQLGLTPQWVHQILETPQVRRYCDAVFLELGFNNRFKLREVMDQIIELKLEELDQAQLGSNKDIADLLLQSHKMTMDLLDREIKLKQLELELEREQQPKNQVNVQINDAVGGNYAQLLQKLLGDAGA